MGMETCFHTKLFRFYTKKNHYFHKQWFLQTELFSLFKLNL